MITIELHHIGPRSSAWRSEWSVMAVEVEEIEAAEDRVGRSPLQMA